MKSHCLAFLILFVIVPQTSFSQYGVVKGRVASKDGEPLPAVQILIKNCNLYAVTDTAGDFKVKQVPAGTFDVECKCIGYKTLRKKITVKQDATLHLNFQLHDTITTLADVEITAKSKIQELKEIPQTVSIIDAKPLQSQSSGSIEIINKVMGVKVRQAGGLGSDATVSINGISGKQIRFFIDGIPSDYFGNGLSINVLPVSLIDRIDIYKGVVPIELGADALGGAVNVVTKRNLNSSLDASYSIGSFNTHKASLNTFYLFPDTRLFTSVNAFLNYSDNNYFVDVDVPDEYGNPTKKKVRRFHDTYRNYLASLETGYLNTKWADLFSASGFFSGMHDHIQHNPTNIEQPYAKVTQQERTFNSTIKYQKKNIIKNLDINAYAGFNHITSLSVDTSIYSYTWDGNPYSFFGKPVIHPFVGEKSSNRKELHFNTNMIVGRLNLKYRLNETASLSFSIISTFYERSGYDTIQEKYFGRNYFQQPESMLKNVMGLSYERKWFDGNLTSITSLKHYYYNANGFEINANKEQIIGSQTKSNTGFNQALRWRFSNRVMARTSYEFATRLPDVSEAFGDFLDISPNPGLLPETSHNINSGILCNGKKIGIECNAFYRNTDHIIYLKTSRFTSQNQNLLKAETKGMEVDVLYKPFKFISISTNATFQDIRNKSSVENSGTTDNRYYNARMPNIPYFFGNAEIRFCRENSGKHLHLIQVWWNMHYVHAFYLYWATDGGKDQKAIIPMQFVQNAGISIMLLKNTLTVSAELFNLADEKVFDNFNIQKPGRNLSFKLRYFIQKK